jgi:predicted transport protein
MATGWSCPKCRRTFVRTHQRHACGTGDPAGPLRGRPPELVALYRALERFVRSLGPVEIVTRDRYVLFRRARIFTDVVVMADALRLAIHLPQARHDPRFEKVVVDRRHATHVAKVRDLTALEALQPYLQAAFDETGA